MKPSFKERLAYWFDSRMSKGTSDLIRLLAIVSVLGIALITVLLVAFGYSEANGVDVFWDSFATIINAWMPYYSDRDGSIGYLVIMAIAAIIGLLITSVLIGIHTTQQLRSIALSNNYTLLGYLRHDTYESTFNPNLTDEIDLDGEDSLIVLAEN